MGLPEICTFTIFFIDRFSDNFGLSNFFPFFSIFFMGRGIQAVGLVTNVRHFP